MKRVFSVIAVMAALSAFACYARAESSPIATYSVNSKTNDIGGSFGTWNKDEGDSTQGCKMSFSSGTKHGDKGYSLQLDYDVDSPNPAYNGFWMKLQNKDISSYDKLNFWVKGDDTAGFSPAIKLELKNSKGEVGRFTLTTITVDWQEVSIPLSQFAGLSDLSSMTEFVIVFDDITCAPKKVGTIYIDDIAFVK